MGEVFDIHFRHIRESLDAIVCILEKGISPKSDQLKLCTFSDHDPSFRIPSWGYLAPSLTNSKRRRMCKMFRKVGYAITGRETIKDLSKTPTYSSLLRSSARNYYDRDRDKLPSLKARSSLSIRGERYPRFFWMVSLPLKSAHATS